MITFLPFPDFDDTAQCLDRQRLGKQRVEGLQIVQIRFGIKSGWKNHPAVLQWEGYEPALCNYVFAMCRAWKRRGYEDSIASRMVALVEEHIDWKDMGSFECPPWLNDVRLHVTHQASLLRKDPGHYGPAFHESVLMVAPTLLCCEGCNYWWPTHAAKQRELGEVTPLG